MDKDIRDLMLCLELYRFHIEYNCRKIYYIFYNLLGMRDKVINIPNKMNPYKYMPEVSLYYYWLRMKYIYQTVLNILDICNDIRDKLENFHHRNIRVNICKIHYPGHGYQNIGYNNLDFQVGMLHKVKNK